MRVRAGSALAAALLASGAARAQSDDLTIYNDRFLEMWRELHDPANGYFSPEGVPYHAPETLIVEAPDQGHETTSEAFSYWLWLEAARGRLSGDWSALGAAWSAMERFIIPRPEDQPTNSLYSPGKPATYAPEGDDPSSYPAPLDFGVPVGQDPLADELATAYGTRNVYGMHWLLDVDDWYGFGSRGDGVSRPSYINTFQRGPQESVWETVPQPSWESFRWGGPNGFLDLFIADSSYARQWRYTDAPDADARAVQALYWAFTWAQAQGKAASAVPVAGASRMGDYLRYALFDKYFKEPGCQSTQCPAGSGRGGAHYLLSWYYAWGGAADPAAGWAWRIGSSHAHFGYQNPLAAYALSQVPALRPVSPSAASDWAASLARQLEFYQWLQSAEGAIAGGATNSWQGRYAPFPPGKSTFHGMAYDEQPVYHDPPSNSWFGWQAWSMQRVAEYYLVTGDAAAGALLDRWVAWVKQVVELPADGSYRIPSTLSWSGQPQTWTGSFAPNPDLHVRVESTTSDVGVAASLARALTNHAAAKAKHAGAVDAAARDLARDLLDRMWALYRDAKGVSAVEARDDYHRMFDQTVFVPGGFSGAMPNGDPIRPGVTFLDVRSQYRLDPDFPRVQAAVAAGQAPQMRYHRFWAQVEIALANADFARLFLPPAQANDLLPSVRITAPAGGSALPAPADVEVRADASDPDGSVTRVEFFADGVKIGEAAAPPYAVRWSGVAEGRYALLATATDDLGGRGSDQIDVVVGNPPPPGGSGGGGAGGGSPGSAPGAGGGQHPAAGACGCAPSDGTGALALLALLAATSLLRRRRAEASAAFRVDRE